mgnify:CR=1 FL=1
MNKAETIKVTCYGKTDVYGNREEAERFYLEAMMNSEGSERDRYVNIYLQLKEGRTECSDVEE